MVMFGRHMDTHSFFYATQQSLLRRLFLVACFILACPLAAVNYSDTDDSNHAEQCCTHFAPSNFEAKAPRGLLYGVVHWLIVQYQTKISTRSVSRCMFEISCSDYATKAIDEKGVILGIAYFIDRNLYREHRFARGYYPLVVNPDESLKLSDSFYLTNE